MDWYERAQLVSEAIEARLLEHLAPQDVRSVLPAGGPSKDLTAGATAPRPDPDALQLIASPPEGWPRILDRLETVLEQKAAMVGALRLNHHVRMFLKLDIQAPPFLPRGAMPPSLADLAFSLSTLA